MVDQSRSWTDNPWGRRVILVLVILATLYGALLLLLSRFLDPQDLAARLEPRLEAAVAREIEIGSATVGFFPLGMRLTDISVADPTGMAPSLAQVRSMEFQVSLLPLLRREIRVRRLVVEGPEAHLRVDPGGLSNSGDLSPTSAEGASTGGANAEEAALPFSLALEAVRIEAGLIDFFDARDSTQVSLEELQVRASVQRTQDGTWAFRGDSEAGLEGGPRGGLAAFSGLPLAASFDISANSEFQSLEVREGILRLAGATMTLAGTVSALKEPVRSVSLGLTGQNISIEGLIQTLPDSIRGRLPELDGILALEFQMDGGLGRDTAPEVSGTLKLDNLDVRARNGTRLARNLSSTLTMNPGGTLQVDLRGEVLDGPFSMTGQGEVGGESPVDLRLDAYPDLSLIEALVAMPEGSALEGRLKVDGRLTGPVRTPRNLRFWGQAAPGEIRYESPLLGVPVSLPGGSITVQGNRASVREFPLVLGEDALTANGEANNLMALGEPGRTVGIRASLRGPRLDLVKLSPNPPPDPNLTYGKVAFARLSDRQVAGETVEAAAEALRLRRPDSIPVAGEIAVALDTVIDARGRMHDVRATASFGPAFLRVAEASFNRYGGRLQAGLNLALGEEGPEPFSLQLSVSELDAGDFLSATSPLGRFFRGRLSLSMELAGSLDSLLLPERPSLVGSGSFQLTEGGMNPNRVTGSLADFLGLEEFRSPDFRGWATGFILENGMIRLAEASLEEAPGDPRVGGSVGLGGELDLLSAFTLPSERLGNFARENLGIAGEVAGRVVNRPEVVQAVIRIGGSIVSPELRADPEATAAALRNALQEEVTSEAQNRIREQRQALQDRATGFLRNLTQGPETPPPPGGDSLPGGQIPGDSIRPDSITPDTTVPDSLKPDTLSPDTLQPDSLNPDTLPPDTSRTSVPPWNPPGGGSPP